MITIDLIHAGERENIVEFAVTAIAYMDMVFDLRSPIMLREGDELCLDFRVPVVSSVDFNETNCYEESWSYSTGKLQEGRRVSHFRFTKRGDDAWIELLDKTPEDTYIPDATKAEKIA